MVCAVEAGSGGALGSSPELLHTLGPSAAPSLAAQKTGERAWPRGRALHVSPGAMWAGAERRGLLPVAAPGLHC